MKALELVVYPEGGCATSADCALKEWCVECVDEHDKRLTYAELAAEFWASHGEANAAMTGNRRLLFSRRATLARFATLPHYDDPTETGNKP